MTPNQVGIAKTQDFTVSVPNEKDTPIVSVKLFIPTGVSSVVPNAEPGWTITTKTSGTGDNQTVSEIDWTGGSIPVGERSELVFQAQVPPIPTTLNWKAYQTYANGVVVSWDVDPKTLANLSDAQQDALADKQNKGEYSTTQVINDLTTTPAPVVVSSPNPKQLQEMSESGNSTSLISLLLSMVAFLLSIASLWVGIKKKRINNINAGQ